MSMVTGTRIASHTHKTGDYRGWGVRIGLMENGEYIIQRTALHPVYKGDYVAIPVAYAKTETEARATANHEWLAQLGKAPSRWR